MKNTVDILVGIGGFGDDGKGKIVDYLVNSGEYYTMVARFNGSNNAGHTIYTDSGKKHVFHHLPSGALNPNVDLFLGSQMVIHPESLLKEIEENNVDLKRIKIAYNAHIVQEQHIIEDKEKNKHIGTTGKGIGPCYKAKIGREGIRFVDWLNNSNEASTKAFKGLAVDVSDEINKRLKCNEKLLCEGAQGTFLDIDHGTYPYVTSSNCLAQTALVSLGLSPHYVNKVYGVTKAYLTRVGNGPMESEITEKYISDKLVILGKEFGATTGRQRRVGWLDIKMLKKAVELNGVTDIVITKIDILNQLGEELNIDLPFLEGNVMHSSLSPDKLLSSNEGIVALIEDYIDNDDTKVSMISVGQHRNDIKLL